MSIRSSFANFVGERRGDHEPGDHREAIDSCEPARHMKPGVIRNDQHDRDRP
jgi:hypothetical protein